LDVVSFPLIGVAGCVSGFHAVTETREIAAALQTHAATEQTFVIAVRQNVFNRCNETHTDFNRQTVTALLVLATV